MKFSLLFACLCVSIAQIYSEETVTQILDEQKTLTDEQIDRFHRYFNQLTGASAQALDDFKSLRIQHWPYLYGIVNFTFENLLSDMNGRNVVIKPEDWQKYLQTYGYQQSDLNEMLQRGEKIPSDQLDADRKSRLITFLKGTKHEATLDDVKAAHAYLYGSA